MRRCGLCQSEIRDGKVHLGGGAGGCRSAASGVHHAP